jgi:hypothetical protein
MFLSLQLPPPMLLPLLPPLLLLPLLLPTAIAANAIANIAPEAIAPTVFAGLS